MKLKKVLTSIFVTLGLLATLGPACVFASENATTVQEETDVLDTSAQLDPTTQKVQSILLLVICVVVVVLLARRSKMKQNENNANNNGENPANDNIDHLDDKPNGNRFGF